MINAAVHQPINGIKIFLYKKSIHLYIVSDFGNKYVFANNSLIAYHISSLIRRCFSFQNNPKNLELSYKTDLDLWDCLGRVKPVLQQNCTGLIRLFVLVLERKSHVL